MSSDATTPDTIVLIHGFWVTPRSWEDWKARYESRGYRVLTPAYPGFEVEVEALNADPTPIEELTVPAVIEHLESVVGELDAPPILMGHSAGGVFTQLLMDRGYGAAGVAINSAPTEGVKRGAALADQVDVPGAQEPCQPPQGGRVHLRAVALRVHEHVQRGGGAAAVRALPHPGLRSRSSGAARSRTSTPVTTTPTSNYKNPDRAPLLFISGSEDHLMPPKIQRSNAKHYKAEGTITEVKEYRGPRAPHALTGRLGGGRRLRADLGGRPRRLLGYQPAVPSTA